MRTLGESLSQLGYYAQADLTKSGNTKQDEMQQGWLVELDFSAALS